MALVVLIGPAGAGKTTIGRSVMDDEPDVQVAHLDLIGVPSPDEMERDHGGLEGWRRWAVAEWMRRLLPVVQRGEPAVLEGEATFDDVEEAAAAVGVACTVVLVDCDDDVRDVRLEEDGRAELASAEERGRAQTLRDDAAGRGARVIDTSMRGVASCMDEVIRLVRR